MAVAAAAIEFAMVVENAAVGKSRGSKRWRSRHLGSSNWTAEHGSAEAKSCYIPMNYMTVAPYNCWGRRNCRKNEMSETTWRKTSWGL